VSQSPNWPRIAFKKFPPAGVAAFGRKPPFRGLRRSAEPPLQMQGAGEAMERHHDAQFNVVFDGLRQLVSRQEQYTQSCGTISLANGAV